jgi:pimeloyl-ACP methyl ester carboxylesterase
VLVGLSMGAVVARRYAREYPDETAGMVMVDHAFLNPGDKKVSVDPAPGPNQPPVLIHQEPIVLTVEDTSNFGNLPARDQELHRWAMSLGPALPTAEMVEACLAEVPATVGKMPLAVVSTGNAVPAYLRLQRELLGLSSDSTQFIADQSFHSVEIDQPEVVVRAIRMVSAR